MLLHEETPEIIQRIEILLQEETLETLRLEQIQEIIRITIPIIQEQIHLLEITIKTTLIVQEKIQHLEHLTEKTVITMLIVPEKIQLLERQVENSIETITTPIVQEKTQLLEQQTEIIKTEQKVPDKIQHNKLNHPEIIRLDQKIVRKDHKTVEKILQVEEICLHQVLLHNDLSLLEAITMGRKTTILQEIIEESNKINGFFIKHDQLVVLFCFLKIITFELFKNE